MASARQLPQNFPAAGPLADRPAPATSAATRWPILARIAEVRRDDDQISAHDAPSSEPSYRVDAPHAAAPSRSHAPTEARPLQRSGAPSEVPPAHPNPITTAPSNDRELPATDHAPADQAVNLPLPIRLAVDTWQSVQPHQELIRFAAMLALMVAGGMSAVLMMRDRLQPAANPSAPVTITASQTRGAESDTQPAELGPKLEPQLEPMVTPSTDTSSIEPTATGPLTAPSQPVMAIESTEPTAQPPYPTTSFAEATLPPLDDCTLPQVQTTEPEVAHLRGDVIETQVR